MPACTNEPDGPQIGDYFRRVLDEHHLASRQVQFFPMSNYLGLANLERLNAATA